MGDIAFRHFRAFFSLKHFTSLFLLCSCCNCSLKSLYLAFQVFLPWGVRNFDLSGGGLGILKRVATAL